jgi:hypothetical protein
MLGSRANGREDAMTDYRPHIVVVEDEAAQRHLLVEYLGNTISV